MINKILLIFTFTFLINIVVAQPPEPGTNILRPNLDKFEGTWKWVSGNSEVILKLKKVNYYYDIWQIHKDVLMGSHKYINNGVLVEDYLFEFGNVSANSRSSVFLWDNMDGSETDKLTGSVKDISKHKKPEHKAGIHIWFNSFFDLAIETT